MTQEYIQKLRTEYIALFFSAYGFLPAPLNIDRYLNADADMRQAVRLKLASL